MIALILTVAVFLVSFWALGSTAIDVIDKMGWKTWILLVASNAVVDASGKVLWNFWKYIRSGECAGEGQ